MHRYIEPTVHVCTLLSKKHSWRYKICLLNTDVEHMLECIDYMINQYQNSV